MQVTDNLDLLAAQAQAMGFYGEVDPVLAARLDEVDDTANAVCQTLQEANMCNCPDGKCYAALAAFERWKRLLLGAESAREDGDSYAA